MPSKPGKRVELSSRDGRPIPNPEPVEAAILSDRSLAVRFEGGPWIRPTDEEISLYGPILGAQPVGPSLGEWFFQCDMSGLVRFTTTKHDKQNSRIGKDDPNNDEQTKFRLLFDKDPTAMEPKAFTCILKVADIKTMIPSSNPEGFGRLGSEHDSTPAANFPIPDVAPIDIPPTPFAHAYSSKGLATMTDKFQLLEHVNCSYLSTLHHAPTLLELKQHAQALAILISEMSGPSTNSAQVNNDSLGGSASPNSEPFDWLGNLNKAYVNLDADHNIPLTTLMNTYHHDQKTARTTQICPLSSLPRTREERDAGKPGLPYMTHEALTSHANECLEILDHEFSAEGGLLAILPDMENNSGRTLSGKTLLGQFILFTQRLVQRVHELELRAANAADLLSGEKVIPDRMIGLIPGLNGRDGTRPTSVAYPQHKYVLANAGAPAWDELTKMLNIKEKMDRDLHTYNIQHGLSASSQWETSRTMEFRSGLTHIDVMTRYTRVWDANSVTGTPTPIFIIPGSAVHPGLTATREMESNPHVVQVIKPQYPERLSMLEEKYEKKMDEYEDIISEYRRLKQDNEDHLETISVQQMMYKDLQAENSYRRAEQQGRGMEDLAKFRNPIAEKERKLDETQRDLDQKLLAAEYALRDAQRFEQATQGELKKLEDWKIAETAKIQAIIQQNAALTAGVRAGYVKNAGIIAEDTSFNDEFGMSQFSGLMPGNKYGDLPASEPLVDVTDDYTEPYPNTFSGMRTLWDPNSRMFQSQKIDKGVVSQDRRSANIEEVKAYERRWRGIREGTMSGSIQDLVVLTLSPRLDRTPDKGSDRGRDVGKANIPNTHLPSSGRRTNLTSNKIPSADIITPASIDYPFEPAYTSLALHRRPPIRHRDTPSTRGSDGNSRSAASWERIKFEDEYQILIAAAMQSIGWDCRFSDVGLDRRFDWYKKDSRPFEVLEQDAWLETLTTFNVSVPIIDTINPDWSKATLIHVFHAMLDAGWAPYSFEDPENGTNLSWSKEKRSDSGEYHYEKDGRDWLQYMATDNAVHADDWDEATEEQIRTSMTRAGYTLADKFGKRKGEENMWVLIPNGARGIPVPRGFLVSMDDARALLKTLPEIAQPDDSFQRKR